MHTTNEKNEIYAGFEIHLMTNDIRIFLFVASQSSHQKRSINKKLSFQII